MSMASSPSWSPLDGKNHVTPLWGLAGLLVKMFATIPNVIFLDIVVTRAHDSVRVIPSAKVSWVGPTAHRLAAQHGQPIER